MPAASTSETFQTFSIPRRSWTIAECRNAVPISHGISAAFSTPSQRPVAAPPELGVRPARAEDDPDPEAQPRGERERADRRIQSLPRRRVTSAPTANANGTVNSVYPE